ncbi:MAG: carboxypeptidase regulatory-like domain-containing protein [Roseiflexaceae bacterium]|nr:carboxypeptidase regulatory-like domain-containing protein [Roseiflexaceae bacterium]
MRRFSDRLKVAACALLAVCALAALLVMPGVGARPLATAPALFGPRLVLPLLSKEGAVVRRISTTLDLRSNAVQAPGDRIRVNINVQNLGNVEVNGITLRLPFDNTRLTFFTHSVDAPRGDQFVGVPSNTRVELLVGRIPVGQTAQVSVWFNVAQRVRSGDRVGLRAVSVFDSLQQQSNEVSFFVVDPGNNGFCGPFRGVNGQMSVNPYRSGVGTLVAFSSDCFLPTERVVTWLNTPTGGVSLPQTATANNNGRVVFQLNTANFAPSDLYGFVAEGTTSGIQVLGPFILTPSGQTQAATLLPRAPAGVQASAFAEQATGSATITGLISGDAGTALRDVLVELRDADNALVSITSSDDTGSYLIGDLADGTYTLYALPGYADDPATTVYGAEQRTVIVGGGVSATANLQLARGGVISGRVSGAGGQPVAGVPVFVRNSGSRPLATAVSAADGSYAAAGLASGSYQIEFDPSLSSLLATTTYLSATVNAVVVNAPATTQADVALLQPADQRIISGRVTSADTGQPLRNVTILLSGALTREFGDVTRTDANGDYQFTELAPRPYQVQALTSFSYGSVGVPYLNQNYASPVDMRNPGVQSGIDFSLAPGAQASGRVSEIGSGLGIENVLVLITRTSDEALVGLVRTDAGGSFLTAGLVPGSYTVTFDGSGSGWAGFEEATRPLEIVGTAEVSGVNAELQRLSKAAAYLPLAGN